MARLFREPLVHFLFGGALLFGLYGLVAGNWNDAPDRIFVDSHRVEILASTFERTWLRPPTPDELDGLIQDFVDEEVLYREGLALGLDRDDSVIRRRLRQKVEYLHSDLSEREAPSEAELESFLAANRERFEEPPRLSFRQVFVSPDAGYPAARRRAGELLERLRSGVAGAHENADPTLLPGAMTKASEVEIASVFGVGFATDLIQSSPEGEQRWTGPLSSSFGLHLVWIDERLPGHLPALAQVRRVVERDYEDLERRKASRRFIEELRQRYEVEIERPRPSGREPPPQTPSVAEEDAGRPGTRG